MALRVPYETLKETIKQVFLNIGMDPDRAETCATIHAQSSADGVESHGLNRVPRFVTYVQNGWIDMEATPELVGAKGAVENYDGHMGIGIINALFCTDRAVQLAKEHGIGCVALKNTTHWMRGGTYAWRMADAGYAGLCWINSESCMPLWGSDECGVGNNPFCMAIPRDDGNIVLDMAMSQYAYGKMGVYRLAGEQLPYPGGFDKDGNLTCDPGAIEESMRALPIGYWKGSGMAICLDLAAAVMANGLAGSDLNAGESGSCGGCCQIFIAYDPYLFGTKEEIQDKVNRPVDAAHATHPDHEGGSVSLPGERTVKTRKKSMEEGVSVDEAVWAQVQALAAGNMETRDIASF